jgi:hypothetical protein
MARIYGLVMVLVLSYFCVFLLLGENSILEQFGWDGVRDSVVPVVLMTPHEEARQRVRSLVVALEAARNRTSG